MAKKEVVKEEGGVQRGFFRRIADTVNPFSSSEEKEEEKKGNGKEEGGFLSLLWPFGEVKKEKGKTSEQGDAQLVSIVAESLKKKGILKTQNPKSNLRSFGLQSLISPRSPKRPPCPPRTQQRCWLISIRGLRVGAKI